MVLVKRYLKTDSYYFFQSTLCITKCWTNSIHRFASYIKVMYNIMITGRKISIQKFQIYEHMLKLIQLQTIITFFENLKKTKTMLKAKIHYKRTYLEPAN